MAPAPHRPHRPDPTRPGWNPRQRPARKGAPIPPPPGWRLDARPRDHGAAPVVTCHAVLAVAIGLCAGRRAGLRPAQSATWRDVPLARMPAPCWRAILATLASRRVSWSPLAPCDWRRPCPLPVEAIPPRRGTPGSEAHPFARGRERGRWRGSGRRMPRMSRHTIRRMVRPIASRAVRAALRHAGWDPAARARDLLAWADSGVGRSVLGEPVAVADVVSAPGSGLSRAAAARGLARLRRLAGMA